MRLFELFEADAVNPTPYYHGTRADFEGVPNPSPSGVYGPGIYLSKRIDTAKSYGHRNGGDATVKEYRIRGKLATDRQLSGAVAQAADEGFNASAKYRRASAILADQGYTGIEDGPVTVIFKPENVFPV